MGMNILVVDDERTLAISLKEYLKPDGIEADIAFDGLAARRMLEEKSYDVLVSDLRMPGLDGMALLRWVREEGPDLPVIMISAHGEIKDAVEAMKQGAYDYLVKPFDPDELTLRLRKAHERRRLELATVAVQAKPLAGRLLIGESPRMREVARILEKAAPSGATILLTGESGTGKEVAARLVHELSGRDGAFVPINMGAFPEHLLESELFGYEKGAFTGADARKQGLFESAQGGTLFLDEIGDLPLHLQVKLLRVIQERKIQRLGSLKGIPIDVRVVAATNRSLEDDVRSGRFREDLFYRINVIRVHLPPLRDRKDDIPLLATAFISRYSKDIGRKVAGISPEAMRLLSEYAFPGNVRELENAIERACILTDSKVLQKEDFGFLELPQGMGNSLKTKIAGESIRVEGKSATLEELERKAILEALERNSNHRERTALELGITRRTLLNKIKEYGIS